MTPDTINSPAPQTDRDAADQLKAEFVANVTHELRTPIHAIIGYAELLREGVYGQLTPEQEETVSYINDSATDLLSLVANLLDISKIEAGKTDLILSHFDLADLLKETLSQLKPLADTKHLSLETIIDCTTAKLRSDRGKVKQILVNLVGNALRFTDHGKITITVSAGSGDHLQISVKDTGMGIPADKLDRVFDKFYQIAATTTRDHGGTGLGLYITRQLVELLAGNIALESSVGKGTTFTVSLPRNYPEIEGIKRLQRRATFVDGHTGNVTGKPLVLVISDNADIARILADGLGAADYSVKVAGAGTEALTLARQLKPLVVLLNSESSTAEFWAVFQQLKSCPETKDIPAIFLGGDAGNLHGAPLTVAAPLSRQEVLRSVRAATTAGKRNVLICDDDEAFRSILKTALTDEGYRVTEAGNGKQAIESLRQAKPDLLLLDLQMPEVDGWGVTRFITQSPELHDLEVLVISGSMLTEQEAATINTCAKGFICKADFKFATVLDKVAHLLQGK